MELAKTREFFSTETEKQTNDKEKRIDKLLAYQNNLSKRKTERYHFPIIESDEYVDMSVIYPTKQLLVKQVLDELRNDDRILSLRLFGSSITMACHKYSDLDFAVELKSTSTETRNEVSEKIQLACNWGADIIWLDHLRPDERLYTEIMNGLVLI